MSSRSSTQKRPSQSTPNHDPPSPVPSPGRKQLEEETDAASDQPQRVSAPLVSTDKDEEEQGKGGPTRAYDQLSHVSPSLGTTGKNKEMDIDVVQHAGQVTLGESEPLQCMPSGPTEGEEIIVTAIRASDVALGLRRLPAGFHVVLHQNGLEWRTENKRSSVNNDVVEWSGPIPISSDMSAIVRLEVYASFEFQPMLGSGEQLRRLTTTVGQLLDRSGKGAPFEFFPKDGEVVSPCSSIQVTVKRKKLENCEPSGSRIIGPHWSTPQPRGRIEEVTNQGHSALTRYRKHGEKRDLEDSVQQFKRALDNCPWDHPCRAAAKSNLGMAKLILSQVEGTDAMLEAALWSYEDALAARPLGHPDRPLTLIQLASVHFARLLRGRDHVDGTSGENAKRLLREVIELSGMASHERLPATVMLELCTGHGGGSVGSGGLSSKEQDLTPGLADEDPQLSVRLIKRFERFGDLGDLQRAITILEGLARSTPIWDGNYCVALGNLGAALQYRFERLGELSDLEDAISMMREAVRLSPDGHPDKPSRLNNLGNSLESRFSRLGELSDLEDAISMNREAVRLSPDGHPDKPSCLNNLGNSLERRFSRLGELSDLEDAISMKREAVRLSPDGHSHKPSRLNNLGSSLESRFSRLGELSDLEDAISMMREAVRLSPDGHPDKPSLLNNLGSSLERRFSRLGELSDLEDAISMMREAVHLTPRGHPQKPIFMNNLSKSFTIRFLRLREISDIERAISLSSHVASIPVGPPSVRFSAAQCWIQYARLIRHHSLLHAYSAAVSLLPKLAWIGLSLSRRYDELTRSAGLIREAAAAALDAGFPQTALEWLEQGRSIVWGDLFQLRSSYDELSSAHPHYASRLHALSIQLDQANAAREQSLSSVSEQNQSRAYHTAESLRQVVDSHRALAIERDKLLQEIRRLPGFERFLRGKPFSQLRAAAHSGPVVILNVTETRGDALIVVPNLNHVIHVPLPALTLERSINLQSTLKGFVGDARVGDTAPRIGVSWKTILFPLWKSVVKPVLDALAFSVTPTDPSRIFWCPTGPLAFLPIHAAGSYDEQYSAPGHKVFDFVVSSYVPTLSTLLESSNSNATAPSSALRLLLVPQPRSDGLFRLRCVPDELKHIKDVVSNSPLACITTEPSDGTVEEVLELMGRADWVHFACHGIQDSVNSGLCLADKRRLKIRDIITLSRPRGGLAFLSACQTAKGEQRLSDEAIHIAAGMLFAGYGGVVGTMWTIDDTIAPGVAKRVYEELLGKGPRADYREAARALHKATGGLRERGVPFDKWIPFIHVGL